MDIEVPNFELSVIIRVAHAYDHDIQWTTWHEFWAYNPFS